MSRSQASNPAAFIVSLVVVSSLVAGSAMPARAQRVNEEAMNALHDRCVAYARQHPKDGLDKAKQWREQGGGFWADHCIAMALFLLKDYATAAKRFEELAAAMMGMPAEQRAIALDQAGQSWLDAGEFARAKAAFDGAIAFKGDDAELFIDRAQAFAAVKQYWEAIDDLNRAIDLAPRNAEAYIYRASAYRSVEALDLAMEDLERGLAIAPNNVLGLLERGNVRRLQGDAAGARQDWQSVVKLAPETPAGKAANLNLAKLGKPEKSKSGAAAAKGKPQATD
jgi:tetratricopeptide (TPR) repeat protein